MASKLTPAEWNRITGEAQRLAVNMELAKTRERVRRAKKVLAFLRKKHANLRRKLVQPDGEPSISRKRIRKVVKEISKNNR